MKYKKIGSRQIGISKPAVVCVVDDTFSNKELKKVVSLGTEIVEARIDRFKKIDIGYVRERLKNIKQITNLPLIITIRHKKEKQERDRHNLSEEERLQIFKDIIPIGDAVDIELNTKIVDEVIRFTRDKKKISIISYHNFHTTPNESILNRILKNALNKQADLIKICTFARTKNDVINLLLFTYKNKDRDLVTMCMGRQGMVSRIIFPLFGSYLTYGFLKRPVAPGQYDIKTLKDLIEKLSF